MVSGGLSFLASAAGAVYHVDPGSGSMSNPGTAAQPWSTLEAVFAANKSFAAGDEIRLRDGYHGAPTVKGSNAGDVTIRPDGGADPKLRNLIIRSGARWVIEGLDISPGHDPSGAAFSGTIVEIESSASRITLRDCIVRTALTTAGWSLDDWKTLPKRGIRNAASNVTLADNRVETTSFGITVRRTGSFTSVSGNRIKGFSHDGIQALADDCVFESNTITDAYVADNSHNHDDFFQSWSVGADGFTVGEGTISRVTLRGNTFISRTDPAQPFASNPQGIGCFDGYYEGWVIENNIIVSRITNGIALHGAIDCKVVNNTVVENPLDPAGGSPRPWINIVAHKTRSQPSSGNLVRNNISARSVEVVPGSSTVDFNQTTIAYPTYFVNPAEFDFSLKATAPARDAGSSQEAPATDITGASRLAPYDLGAHEFRVVTGTTYAQWLAANDLPPDGSGDGAPDADPLGDGVTNGMKFALGLPVSVRGHGDRMTTGIQATGGQRYLSLSFTHPDPAPAGVSYEVQTAAGLAGWSGTSTVVVSDTVAGGLRTRVVRDSVPIGGESARRFIRLVVDAP